MIANEVMTTNLRSRAVTKKSALPSNSPSRSGSRSRSQSRSSSKNRRSPKKSSRVTNNSTSSIPALSSTDASAKSPKTSTTTSTITTSQTPIKFWFVNTMVYVFLGFLGAISAAFPLFLIQRTLLTTKGPVTIAKPRHATLFLTLMILLALLSNTLTPFLTLGSPLYSLNLHLLHLFFALPILSLFTSHPTIFLTLSPTPPPPLPPTPPPISSTPGVGLSPLYSFIAGMSLMNHTHLLLDLFLSKGASLESLFSAVFEHPCQRGITLDLCM
jgi:hypothetical protein